jgi:hypothetical protein
MPRNPESEKRKKHIATVLENLVGPLYVTHSRRSDWYTSKGASVDIFITDSKATYNQRPWFDMRDDDLQQLARHANGFVIFILGDDARFLVVPAQDLVAQLPSHREGLLDTSAAFSLAAPKTGTSSKPYSFTSSAN